MKLKPGQVRKALVAAVTGLSEVLVAGGVPDPFVPYALGAIAALGAYGVYRVPNDPAPPRD